MMTRLTGPAARILLRYGAGGLVAAGMLGATEAEALMVDPDAIEMVMIGLGALAAFVAELAYATARRYGWET